MNKLLTKIIGITSDERDHLGDPGVDGRIILRCILGSGSMDWIELAQDTDRWRALVNAVRNLLVP